MADATKYVSTYGRRTRSRTPLIVLCELAGVLQLYLVRIAVRVIVVLLKKCGERAGSVPGFACWVGGND